jgi:hypothetical protein
MAREDRCNDSHEFRDQFIFQRLIDELISQRRGNTMTRGLGDTVTRGPGTVAGSDQEDFFIWWIFW